MVKYISPTSPVYYGRSHWAIENLLSQPEFQSLQWTSLQPNLFTINGLASVLQWIKQYKKTGKQETLKILIDADAAVALIDPEDVGMVAAHLLALEDISVHNQAKYVLNGPEDITGKQIVEAVEQLIGIKVQNTQFLDMSWIDDLIKTGIYSENLVPMFIALFVPYQQGQCSLAGIPASKEILELAPPKRTLIDALKSMIEE